MTEKRRRTGWISLHQKPLMFGGICLVLVVVISVVLTLILQNKPAETPASTENQPAISDYAASLGAASDYYFAIKARIDDPNDDYTYENARTDFELKIYQSSGDDKINLSLYYAMLIDNYENDPHKSLAVLNRAGEPARDADFPIVRNYYVQKEGYYAAVGDTENAERCRNILSEAFAKLNQDAEKEQK